MDIISYITHIKEKPHIMDLTKKEFSDKAKELIEANNVVQYEIIAILNRKKGSIDSRQERVEAIKKFVSKHFNIESIDKVWNFIHESY